MKSNKVGKNSAIPLFCSSATVLHRYFPTIHSPAYQLIISATKYHDKLISLVQRCHWMCQLWVNSFHLILIVQGYMNHVIKIVFLSFFYLKTAVFNNIYEIIENLWNKISLYIYYRMMWNFNDKSWPILYTWVGS